jgi:hypothetical protein
MQRGGEDPAVTAIVARAGGDDHAVREQLGESQGDLRRGSGAGALHERARGDAGRDRRGIDRPRAGGVDDRDAGYFCDAPTMRP